MLKTTWCFDVELIIPVSTSISFNVAVYTQTGSMALCDDVGISQSHINYRSVNYTYPLVTKAVNCRNTAWCCLNQHWIMIRYARGVDHYPEFTGANAP